MIDWNGRGARTSAVLGLSCLMLLAPQVAAAGGKNKVEVCHIPGNSANYHTIVISEKALDKHLAHGDLEGACDEHCATLCDDGDPCTIDDVGSCEGGCPAPEPVDCRDDDLCTIEWCDPDEGCLSEPVNCPAGEQCNPDDGLCEVVSSGPALPLSAPMDSTMADQSPWVVLGSPGLNRYCTPPLGEGVDSCGGPEADRWFVALLPGTCDDGKPFGNALWFFVRDPATNQEMYPIHIGLANETTNPPTADCGTFVEGNVPPPIVDGPGIGLVGIRDIPAGYQICVTGPVQYPSCTPPL